MFWRALTAVSSVLFPLTAAALPPPQSQTCPLIVEQALERVGDHCRDLGRNQVCYGNRLVTAATWKQTALPDFDTAGDMASLVDLATLATAPLDATTGDWGVAMLAVQANLPDTLPGQNIVFMVLGDAELRSEVPPPAVVVEAAAAGRANLRGGPGTQYGVVGGLAAGQALTLAGRNAAGDWLLLAGGGDERWVFADLVAPAGDVAALPAVEPGANRFNAPMQAFRLRTGLSETRCQQAPPDGVLLQLPVTAKVHFRINGITVDLASTIFLSAARDDELTVSTFRGVVSVTSAGVTRRIPPGYTLTVREGQPPGQPQPYDYDALQAAPVQLMPVRFAVPPPGR